MTEQEIKKIVREELLKESYDTGDFVESIVAGLDSHKVYQTGWNEFVIDMNDGPRKDIRVTVDASKSYIELSASGGYEDFVHIPRKAGGMGAGANEAREWVMDIIRNVPNK